MYSVTLNLNQIIKLTDEQFYQLATAHPDLQIERTPERELVIMPPTGGESGKRNFSLRLSALVLGSAKLRTWSRL